MFLQIRTPIPDFVFDREQPNPDLQGFTVGVFPGFVNFVPAAAYLFFLNLPAAFLQPGIGLIDIPCIKLGMERHQKPSLSALSSLYIELLCRLRTFRETERATEETEIGFGWEE